MVSFVSRAEEVAPVGIGNQQIVRDTDPGNAALISGIGNTLLQGAEIAGNKIAESRAQDIVTSAQADVERTRGEIEQIQSLDTDSNPEIQRIIRQSTLLQKKVASGKMSRDNARLLVSNSVNKAIEAEPFLTDQIRTAASEFLGFNLASEASRQFFSSFGTAESTKLTAGERQDLLIAETNDISLKAAKSLRGQGELLKLQKDIALSELAIDDTVANKTFRTINKTNQGSATNFVFSRIAKANKEGQPISEVELNQLIDLHRNQEWQRALNDMSSTGNGPSPQLASTFREQWDATYDVLREQIKNFDTGNVQKKEYEDIIVGYQLWGARSLPIMTAIKANFGERTLSSVMDLVASANGDQTRLRALLATDARGFAPVLELINTSPEDFSREISRTLGKIESTETTKEDFTELEGSILDTILAAGRRSPPDEIEKTSELLDTKGLTHKATSYVVNAGRVGATPKTVRRMSNEWNTVQAVKPFQIANQLAETNAVMESSDFGLSIDTKIEGQAEVGQRSRGASHDAFENVQKINIFFEAMNKGWKNDLKVTSPRALSNKLAADINRMADKIRAARLAGIKKQETQDILQQEALAASLADPRGTAETLRQQREEGRKSKVLFEGDQGPTDAAIEKKLERLQELEAKVLRR